MNQLPYSGIPFTQGQGETEGHFTPLQTTPLEMNETFRPPLLEPALQFLKKGFQEFLQSSSAAAELRYLLHTFAGRPTPVTYARHLSQAWGGTVLLKREDLVHGGAHKLNNALGQCLLAKSMGYKEVIAETGAGQHGVATAIAAAQLGLKAIIYQGAVDVARQKPNAQRMRLLGAQLVAVEDGDKTLKEAINAAMRDWVARYRTAYYCLGSVVGPYPYPVITRTFQRVIGDEAFEQSKQILGKVPDAVFACVGGGSNAAGIFTRFVEVSEAQLIGCEAAGAASLVHGTMGVIQGMESLVLQTPDRQIAHTHSVSAGLDYPGVGPWLADLKLKGRLSALAITDAQALAALKDCARQEGIIAALETAHALAGAQQHLRDHPGSSCLVCLSGRGDKDLGILEEQGL